MQVCHEKKPQLCLPKGRYKRRARRKFLQPFVRDDQHFSIDHSTIKTMLHENYRIHHMHLFVHGFIWDYT